MSRRSRHRKLLESMGRHGWRIDLVYVQADLYKVCTVDNSHKYGVRPRFICVGQSDSSGRVPYTYLPSIKNAGNRLTFVVRGYGKAFVVEGWRKMAELVQSLNQVSDMRKKRKPKENDGHEEEGE